MASGLLDVLILYRNENAKPEAARTRAWLETFRVKVDASLARFDSEIDRIAAARFGIAQITLGVCLSYLDFRFAALDWRARHPALQAWHAGFCDRPSVVATAVVDDV